MFIIVDLKKQSSETELQYIWRLCFAKDSGTLEKTWEELACIFNKELRSEDEEWTSSAYRKKYQQAKSFYDDVFSKMQGTEYSDNFKKEKRELEKLKIQYRDERNAWNKQNYIDARVSQKLDYLEEIIKQNSNYEIKADEVIDTNSDNDILLILSDLHIGETFKSYWGEYNTDIAADRLSQLCKEVIKIQKMHNSENIYISLQGDLISGAIHKTIQVSNRENVIEQIKIASDMISGFCFSLSHYFKNVIISGVSGNHTRIDKKDEAIHDERLDDLILWIIKGKLSNCSNIAIETNFIDTSISTINIRGKIYVGVHGDYDKFSKMGVGNLSMALGQIPYAILYGHLHTCAVDEYNGVKMIRGGSLAGSGDDYTIEQRLVGKPAQMICVCNTNGVIGYYPIELK